MPVVNRYIDIDNVEREAKKDYIDRHSPFIYVEGTPKKGEKLAVKVVVGNEYSHPDDFDHYIQSIRLFNGETLLSEANFTAGMLGGQDSKGQVEVVFNIVPTTKKLKLVAQAYCTKHGLWENEEVVLTVED